MEPDVEAQRSTAETGDHVATSREQTEPSIPVDADNDLRSVEEASETPPAASSRTRTSSEQVTSSSASSSTSSGSGSSGEVNENAALYEFAAELRAEKPPGEPWYMEMTRLRRLYFLYLNRQLAQCRKRILERREVSDDEMNELKVLLRDQADAIRDFQYIRSLDVLSTGQMKKRRDRCKEYFPETAHSRFPTVRPFETENYRCLPRLSKTALEPFSDEVREFLRIYLPRQLSWTDAEKTASLDFYDDGYAPNDLGPNVDRLARFIVAMVGALFILVPMYIMALHQNRTKNLVTTTIAVVLFALLCSLTLRTSNDQTLGATAGYAAVLTVFVGLTSTPA